MLAWLGARAFPQVAPYNNHIKAPIPGRERLEPEMLPHSTPRKSILPKPSVGFKTEESRTPHQTTSTSTLCAVTLSTTVLLSLYIFTCHNLLDMGTAKAERTWLLFPWF